MRLLVARCEVLYTGRLTARLPEAVRLLIFKADGSFSTPLQDRDIRSILICRVRTIAVFAL
jgi:RecB family endonuclease NucS